MSVVVIGKPPTLKKKKKENCHGTPSNKNVTKVLLEGSKKMTDR